MRRPILLLSTASTLAALMCMAPQTAEASFTLAGSAGTALVLGGDTNRGPFTFEVGPGYQFSIVRLEAPLVFAAAENGTFPQSTNAFLGVRPTLKLFVYDPFYAKISTQLYFGGEEDSYGFGLGGGIEYTFLDVVGVFGEVTVNPYLDNGAGLPLEARAGATFRF